MHCAFPSSLTAGSACVSNKSLLVFRHVAVCPCTTSKAFKFFGLGFGLSEGGSLPSGVGGVSSKAAASIFVPSIAVPSRPPRSFWISQIYRSSVPLSLSLSRPHLANDEAHALYHGYACSESTSASLRPKFEQAYRVRQTPLLRHTSSSPALPKFVPLPLPVSTDKGDGSL